MPSLFLHNPEYIFPVKIYQNYTFIFYTWDLPAGSGGTDLSELDFDDGNNELVKMGADEQEDETK